MAVDSKPGSNNGTNGAATNGASQKNRRKRPSSLQASASSLPTVEHSLEEFIAKANQTLVDVSTWGNAENEAKEQDAQRREVDALRWKAAEGQLREGEARESSLRRQLDGLQGKLAEAEARAAVASSQQATDGAGSAAHDATISELKAKIEQAERDRRLFEEQKQALSQQLVAAKQDADLARTSAAAITRTSAPALSVDDGEAEERVRLAEAKAAKAIAAARAAQAGLTVSSADLAAIESGLVVAEPAAKSTPWFAIVGAFLGGLVIMFVVWKFALSKTETAPAPQPAAVTQPTVTSTPTPAAAPAPAKPIVTPIEETPTAVETKPGAAEPAPAAVETKPAPAAVETKPAPAAVEAKPETVDTKPAATIETKPEPSRPAKATKPAPAKAAPAKATKAAPAKAGISDPFGETAPAKAPAKKPKSADKKPTGGIVDPF